MNKVLHTIFIDVMGVLAQIHILSGQNTTKHFYLTSVEQRFAQHYQKQTATARMIP